MSDLHEMRCVACRGAEPALDGARIAELLVQVPEWQIVEVEGMKRLQRALKFHDFEEAMAFTNRVAALAQNEDHHPLIIVEWGKVAVQWWTHKIGGLHQNDFIMASKIDRIPRR